MFITKTVLTAIDLLRKIHDLGFEAYIVGGAVRDILAGRETDDVDITTNCPIKILEKHFETYDIGQSKDFGICLLRYKDINYEVAQFRSDGIYSDGRHPDSVEVGVSLEEDLKRRDFTINAMAINKNGDIIDNCDGRKDLENRILRTVGDPVKRFNEDYLRMLRAARFAALGFKIESRTRRAIRKYCHNIKKITPERIRGEFYKASKYGAKEFASFIQISDNLGLLAKIIPEISVLKYYKHNLKHHPEGITVFDHVLKCLEIARTNDFIVLMAILLHDVGKGITFSEDSTGVHYYRHEQVGQIIAEDILNRLRFSNFQKDAILFAVGNHMRFNHILDMRPSKIAKLLESPYFDILVEVAWADEFSRGEEFMHYGEFNNKLERINEVASLKKELVRDKALIDMIDGNKIMTLCNLEPSPLIGKIKRSVADKIIDENISNYQEIIDDLILEIYNKMEENNEL